jgi:hypothetical protein
MGIILVSPFVTNFFFKYLATTWILKRKATLELSRFSFSFLNVGLAQGIQSIIKIYVTQLSINKMAMTHKFMYDCRCTDFEAGSKSVFQYF